MTKRPMAAVPAPAPMPTGGCTTRRLFGNRSPQNNGKGICNMIVDQNEWVRSLNAGLPDDVARLKAAGYYREAIERIDAYLAEDWTAVQNGPNAGANPAPGGVDAWRAALRAQREMMRRLP